MAYPYTRSRARGEVADSDIEPSDSATSPPSIFEGPSVEAVEGPESVSTGIVVAEIHVESDQPPGIDDDSTSTSRQPSATAAAARLPPEGPSLASNYGDG